MATAPIILQKNDLMGCKWRAAEMYNKYLRRLYEINLLIRRELKTPPAGRKRFNHRQKECGQEREMEMKMKRSLGVKIGERKRAGAI